MCSHHICHRTPCLLELGDDTRIIRFVSILTQLERRLHLRNVDAEPDDAIFLSLHRLGQFLPDDGVLTIAFMVLKQLQPKQTIVLSNGTDAMLAELIQNAGFTDLFEELVSIDGIKQAKPSPAAYMHWFKNSGLKRDEVLFLSSNGWDIAGAKNFGFHTAWINRDGKPVDMPDLAPDAVYEDLSGILEWVTDEAAWP